MRESIFKLWLAALLLSFVHPLLGQHVITEYFQPNSNSSIKASRILDNSKYELIRENEEVKTYHKTPSIHHQNAPESINDLVPLVITLEFDPSLFHAQWGIMVYDESGYINFANWQGSPVTIDVPAGTYDIIVEFTHNSRQNHIVIKELQEVQTETNVTIDVEEATNYVKIDTYNQNGELLNPGVNNPQTNVPSNIIFDRSMYFLPTKNSLNNSTYMWEVPFLDDDSVWSFYVSDLSERYSIPLSFIGTHFEDGNYFTKFETLNGISESVLIENNPEDWVFHTEEFQPSQINEGEIFSAFSTLNLLEFDGDYSLLGGWNIQSTISSAANEPFKAYLNNPMDDNISNVFVTPGIIDQMAAMNPGWNPEGVFIKGNSIYSDNGKVQYGSFGLSFSWYFLGMEYYYDVNGFQPLPFHPKFSFDNSTSPNIVIGNNTPIAVTKTNIILEELNEFKAMYKGMYGENRESDFLAAHIEAKHNGNVIFSGNYMDFRQEELPLEGDMEMTLTNENVIVDGLDGKNSMKLTYSFDREDNPPTLQMLQFRNSSEEVTNVFETVQEASVRLAAADYQYIMIDEWSGYLEYNEGNTVEFYYSLYNQDNWTELELSNYEEYFMMPAFGDYYESSLADIVVPQENSWFDVKIICTDVTGNKQEQIISPAFKVKQITMGMEEKEKLNFTAYPNPFTHNLNIRLPENIKGNSVFKVMDLTGKTVYSQDQIGKSFVWNGSSLPKGVYIISIENNGKPIAQKVIKK